jgi:hypothetical protein
MPNVKITKILHAKSLKCASLYWFLFKTSSSAPDLEWTWNSKCAILPRRNIAQPSSAQYPAIKSTVK